MMSSKLLKLIIEGGHSVALFNGRLLVTSKDQLPAPTDWLTRNRVRLLTEIANLMRLEFVEFSHHSTGYYGRGRYEGVTMQFNHLNGEQVPYFCFNASLKSRRASRNRAAQSDYAGKAFYISDNGRGKSARALLIRLGVPEGVKNSRVWEHLGKIKGKILSCKFKDGNKIDKQSLTVASINSEAICAAYKNSFGQSSDNFRTISGQFSDKESGQRNTSNPDTARPTSEFWRVSEMERKELKGASNKLTPSLPKYTNNEYSVLIQEQTVDQWLEDYEQAGGM